MMDNGLGISFAPTQEQSELGNRTGGLEGIPQAIKVLSLRMPRVQGAQAPAPGALLNARGGQGLDPFLSALMQTLARTLAPSLGDMGGGMPQQAMGQQMGSLSMPQVSAPPKVIFNQPNPPLPGGTAGPGPSQGGPMHDPRPSPLDGFGRRRVPGVG